MAEHPDAEASGKPATPPAGKAARPWVTRAETMAALALLAAFLVWVGVIICRQREAGRDLRWVRGQGKGATYLIDINHAELPELLLLPGIGKGKAAGIIKWRQAHGQFHAVEELRKAADISASELAAIRSMVTLDGPKPEPEPEVEMDFDEPDSE